MCHKGVPDDSLGTVLTRNYWLPDALQDLQQQLDAAGARASAAEARNRGAAAEVRELKESLLNSAQDVARLTAELQEAVASAQAQAEAAYTGQLAADQVRACRCSCWSRLLRVAYLLWRDAS